MNRRMLSAAAVAAGAALAVACLLVVPWPAGVQAEDGDKKAAKKLPDNEVFGLTKVWPVHLTVSAKEYQAMQPAGGFMFGPPGKAKEKKKDKDKRKRDKNLWGVEFPRAEGEVAAGAMTYKKVSLRYDGNGSYFASANDLKRPFRLDLARHEKQNFHGLETINLHPGASDPSRLREALAYTVFRAAGVPAPRTGFAEVTLTVPGKYAKEYLGLYTLVEEVDRAFLKDRFKTDKGLLMRPQRMRGLDYLGNDWAKYKDSYQPQSEATKEEARRVIAFTRLINEASDADFRKEIGSYLDIDAFLRFLAANALVANAESFFALGSRVAAQ